MKTAKLISLSVLAYLLASCGNSSGRVKDNDVLGKFPGIYVKAAEEYAALEEKKIINPVNRWKKEESINKRAIKSATREFEKIKGRAIPFEVLHEDENFEVVAVTIDDASVESGILHLKVDIRAKKDLPAHIKGNLYYFLVDNANVVYSGEFEGWNDLDPYDYYQIMTPPRAAVAQGQVLNERGSCLNLHCGHYDHTNFAKILFVKEADYYGIQKRQYK